MSFLLIKTLIYGIRWTKDKIGCLWKFKTKLQKDYLLAQGYIQQDGNHCQNFTRHYGSEKLVHVATVHHC